MSAPLLIAVFARAPVEGVCKTRLIPSVGRAGAAVLHAAMTLDVLESAGRCPASRHVLFAATEHSGLEALRMLAPASWEVLAQRPGDLGARLSGALEDAGWRAGAIFLGTDLPHLSAALLEHAAAALKGGRRAVLGPAEDGGYYLLGLSEPDRAVFEGVPWSSADTAHVQLGRLEACGFEVAQLRSNYDVDRPEDLERLAAELQLRPERAPHTARALRDLAFS